LLRADWAVQHTNNYLLILHKNGEKSEKKIHVYIKNQKKPKPKAPYKFMSRQKAHFGASEIERRQKASIPRKIQI